MFANTRFWIAQRVPSRAHYKSLVQNYEGIVTPLEKHADILISDHVRHRDAPPGSLSYQFLEECEKQGRLLPADERSPHLCGPQAGSVRDVADTTRAPKPHRAAYTPEDDEVIRAWVKNAVKRGGRLGGNEIWKDLEKQNGRHPWQSWRDRWGKKLQHQMPPGWELDIRGLEEDVDEILDEVLEEETRSEALQREEEDMQVSEGEVEGEREKVAQFDNERRKEVEEKGQGQRKDQETERAVQREKKTLLTPAVDTNAQRPSTHQRAVPELLGRVAQAALQREKERLLLSREADMKAKELSPQKRPAPVVPGPVAQAMLKGKKSAPKLQAIPSSPPVPAKPSQTGVGTAQPPSEPAYSERALSEFQREPSVGYTPSLTKRTKYDHLVSAAHEKEWEERTDTLPVVSSTKKASPPAGESNPLPRPFTAEDFLKLYDVIDIIMGTDSDGLRASLEAFAPSTDFSPQQWLRFLQDDVLSFHRRFNSISRKQDVTAACLAEYIERNPSQPWRRWRLHYEAGVCQILTDTLNPDVAEDSQTSQSNSIRLQTPSRKRTRDDLEESPQYKSPRVAETANISRQRVDINSQSTASGTSQGGPSRIVVDEDNIINAPSTFPQTQAILAAETQSIDLSMPDPDAQSDDSIAESIESDDFDRERMASLRDQELINQQLLDNTDETKVPNAMDLDLPEPEDGFEPTEDLSEGIETQLLKDTQALHTVHIEEVDEEIDATEETASQSSLDFDALANELMEKGHSPENIITAIHTTMVNMPLVLIVLESLEAGTGLPKLMRGVWTEQDDEDILGGDARKLERVEAKHGWSGESGCKARQYFLRDSMAAAEDVARQ